MKKIYLLACAVIFTFSLATAQSLSGYNFSKKSGIQVADMSGATEIFASGLDEVSSGVLPLGFIFNFGGNTYSQFSVSEDGYMALGASPVVGDFQNQFLSSHPVYPVIAPFQMDLWTGNNGSVSYKLVDVNGSNRLVVDWNVASAETGSDAHLNFQVWLTEGSTDIQIVYGDCLPGWNDDYYAGIAASAVDMLSVDVRNGTTSTTDVINESTGFPVLPPFPGVGVAYVFGTGSITPPPPPPPASITVSITPIIGGPFCGTITLQASSSVSANYTWSNGSTGSLLFLNGGSPAGNYIVTATANGVTARDTFHFAKASLLSSYTIIGRSITLGSNNAVGGSLGTFAGGIRVAVGNNSTVAGDIYSTSIVLGSATNVAGSRNFSHAPVAEPQMLFNSSVTSNLANLTIADNAVNLNITANHNLVTIGRNARVVLGGNVYGKIVVKEGAEVSFTSTELSIDDILTESGSLTAGATPTRMVFKTGSTIRIKNKVTIGDRNEFMGNSSTMYMGDLNNGSEKITVNGKKTTFSMSVYMPKGHLFVRGADAANPCTMIGTFVSEFVEADNYVNWQPGSCAPTAVISRTSGNPIVANAIEVKSSFKLYPNPVASVLNVELNAPKVSRAELTVVSLSGMVIFRQNVVAGPGQTGRVDVSHIPSGIYMVKVAGENISKEGKIIITH